MIQRFEYVGSRYESSSKMVESEHGTFTLYANLAWYRRRYVMSLILNVVVVMACAGMAAYLVTGKYAPEPTAVVAPMAAGEKAELLKELNEARKGRDDFQKLSANYKAQIKVLLKAIDDDDRQLEALQQRGKVLDQLNKDQALKMGNAQETIVAAKKVLGPLGVSHVQVVER